MHNNSIIPKNNALINQKITTKFKKHCCHTWRSNTPIQYMTPLHWAVSSYAYRPLTTLANRFGKLCSV